MSNGFGIPRNFRPRSFPETSTENTIFTVAEPIPDAVLYGEPGPNGEPNGTSSEADPGADGQEDRWLAGINFYPIELTDLECIAPDCAVDDSFSVAPADADTSQEGSDPTLFNPIEVRTSEYCSTIGLNVPELADRLSARFLAQDAAKLTKQVLLGTDCWSSAFVADSAQDAGAAATIYAVDEAVARLIDAMGATMKDLNGTLFIPTGLLEMLGNRGGLVKDPDGSGWTTLTGFDIISDGGVTGEGDSIEGSTVGTDFLWIYGTGVLYAHRGPLQMLPAQLFDATDDEITRLLPRNVVRFIARRYMIAAFDPALCWRIPAAYASSVFVS